MSFTIWHDRPLTPAKMEAIATSSAHIIQFASQLQPFTSTMRQTGWTDQDAAFFEEKRLQLSRVATELQNAAKDQNKAAVTSFFLHLDFTCHSCHERFRPTMRLRGFQK
jgi:cytochrome c556